jgi:SAM-dependent methyltransferase
MSTIIASRARPRRERDDSPLRGPAPPRVAQLLLEAAGQRVIEIGCGLGELTRKLMDREQVIALDPAPVRVARLLGEFGSRANFQAFSMEVTAARFRQLSDYRPDSVLCVHGLERVENDRRALFHMLSVLRPGGRIVLLAHACPKLFSPLDFSAGLYRRYSAESLSSLAQEIGLRVLRMEHVNLTGLLSTWWETRLLRRSRRAGATWVDRLLTPFLARVEDYLRLPFGNNLFAVFERSGSRMGTNPPRELSMPGS